MSRLEKNKIFPSLKRPSLFVWDGARLLASMSVLFFFGASAVFGQDIDLFDKATELSDLNTVRGQEDTKPSDEGLDAVLSDNSMAPRAPLPPPPESLKDLPPVASPNENPPAPRSSGSNAPPARGPAPDERPRREIPADEQPLLSGNIDRGSGGGDRIVIKKGPKQRAINVSAEVPAVRHVTMSPASHKFGGDELEVRISPIYDVVIRMPEAIQFVKSSNQALRADRVPGNPNLCVLKLANVQEETPISLHIVDASRNIYTFEVWGGPADLGWEYPKTIIINRRVVRDATVGKSEEEIFFDGLGVEDAIQYTVGDIPLTQEYEIELVDSNYNPGYIQYNFRISRRDRKSRKELDPTKLVYTFWANDRRLDAGPEFSYSRNVEWKTDPKLLLSRIETRRRGRPTLRISVQIRASILDLEDWSKAFITVADDRGYTRFNFDPMIRNFRAPHAQAPSEDE